MSSITAGDPCSTRIHTTRDILGPLVINEDDDIAMVDVNGTGDTDEDEDDEGEDNQELQSSEEEENLYNTIKADGMAADGEGQGGSSSTRGADAIQVQVLSTRRLLHDDEAAGPLMGDETKAKADAIKYDVEHSDPAAKVVIQSNDGVRFRISEWCDICEDPSTPPRGFPYHLLLKANLEDQPIPVNYSQVVLRTFLLMLYPTGINFVPLPLSTPVQDVYDLLSLSTEWGAEPIQRAAIARIEDMAYADPWSVFAFASRRGEMEQGLARKALRYVGRSENDSGPMSRWEDMKWDEFKDIDPAYLFELLRLAGSAKYHSTSTRKGQINWDDVSRAFNVTA